MLILKGKDLNRFDIKLHSFTSECIRNLMDEDKKISSNVEYYIYFKTWEITRIIIKNQIISHVI